MNDFMEISKSLIFSYMQIFFASFSCFFTWNVSVIIRIFDKIHRDNAQFQSKNLQKIHQKINRFKCRKQSLRFRAELSHFSGLRKIESEGVAIICEWEEKFVKLKLFRCGLNRRKGGDDCNLKKEFINKLI